MEYSFQSCRVREGAAEFDGLRGIKVEPKIEGGKQVFTNRLRAIDHTRGQLSVSGSLKMLLRTALDLVDKGKFLTTIHTFTISLNEGALTDKLTVVGCRLLGLPPDLNGNEEIEVEIPFNALDFQVNGVSIMLEVEEGG